MFLAPQIMDKYSKNVIFTTFSLIICYESEDLL